METSQNGFQNAVPNGGQYGGQNVAPNGMSNGYNQYDIPEEYKPLSIGQFIGYQLLFAIPCVGFIITIVFACGAVKNKNLINWARAELIIMGILMVLYFILMMLGLGVATINSPGVITR